MKKSIFLAGSLCLLIACTSNHSSNKVEEVIVTGIRASDASMDMGDYLPPASRNNFEKFATNPVVRVADQPVSTFAADVDTASYSFVRRQLNDGYLPNPDSVRLEEMINYFDYDYRLPNSAEKPFSASIHVQESPWASGRQLLHIGIQGYELELAQQPKSNLVFLLDVSGSMEDEDKLPLVKKSLSLLLSRLQPDDTVAIVVYAGAAGVVLPPTRVQEKTKIKRAMNSLAAGGSTAGAQGIQLAYQLAQENFQKGAVNRIILATDGDFNVGIADPDQLKKYVERKREEGIYLSVLGFGDGNYNDHMMQALAQNGNGVAAYIDTLSEAQKVLLHEATSSLFPIATDLKIQVEFNPELVQEYRLLGYETRALQEEDFKNDKVDAGDIGSGHSVTAIYEISLAGSDSSFFDKPRYNSAATDKQNSPALAQELAYLKIRYKLPGQKKSELVEYPVYAPSDTRKPADDILKQETNFAIAVAAFAQLLRDDKYLQGWTYDDVISLAQTNKGQDQYGYRAEFVQLVRKAKVAKVLE